MSLTHLDRFFYQNSISRENIHNYISFQSSPRVSPVYGIQLIWSHIIFSKPVKIVGYIWKMNLHLMILHIFLCNIKEKQIFHFIIPCVWFIFSVNVVVWFMIKKSSSRQICPFLKSHQYRQHLISLKIERMKETKLFNFGKKVHIWVICSY